jgi:hypothetical protein
VPEVIQTFAPCTASQADIALAVLAEQYLANGLLPIGNTANVTDW